ncbi:protein FAR1-RELATED SEQUENCE 5-like [Coffea arabica]|uniref:Protein FAR1-RELATED SEQUENCE 5-like n=1 Tax=Coffea arabica TaxID=13443 RepID=A0ABM4V9Q4_COFAR
MDCSKLAEDRTPELGMEFNSEEDAYKFYNKYAFKIGFSVRKDYLNKDKNDVTTSRRYSCCREGVKHKHEGDVMPKRTRAPTKIGCGAKMVIVLPRETMKYLVHDLVLEYNHELHIAQCSHMMPSQRKVSEAQGFQSEISEDARFSLKQSHKFMGKEAGGMVTFDTTYKTNKEYRPFGVFVGFNQHRQIVIFGAALMYDEMIDSFKWARCMMKERRTAGMRSTQLSESLNAAIKNYLKLDHDLVQFFRHFNRMVDEKRHNELIAEYEMRQKLPMIKLRQIPMLVHASETYSPMVFAAFQNEYDESTAIVILRQQDAGIFVEFTVMRYDGGPKRIVIFNQNNLSERNNTQGLRLTIDVSSSQMQTLGV